MSEHTPRTHAGDFPVRTEKIPALPPDFNQTPFLVIWEVTRACDLKCVHCRAAAIPFRDPRELSFDEGCRLIDQVREFGRPLFVLTGGDPLKRPDIFDLIRYGDQVGLRVAMTPSGTSLMTPGVIRKFQEAGLARLAVSLDGSSKEIHDTFRQVDGSFDWTVGAIREARRIGLPVQVNSTVSKHNRHDLAALARFLETLDIVLWSVFFLVPTGRGTRSDAVSATEHEAVFHQLIDLAKTAPFDIKTTAGQHFRRVVIQRRRKEQAALTAQGLSPAAAAERVAGGARPRIVREGGMEPGGWIAPPESPLVRPDAGGPEGAGPGGGEIGRSARGVNDGNGLVFIDHVGKIYPSGFLPIEVGDIRRERLADVYRDHPLMRDLRDYRRLSGKCGYCDFRDLCGGSRARAFAVTGDPLASEPYCCYHPPKPKPAADGVRG